jgi:transcriptional regulator with XRE-family HTH domain
MDDVYKPGVTAQRISELRESLGLNQAAFARLLHLSSMSVSRWERGLCHPSSEQYVMLGKLAGDQRAWFFWERAGLTRDDVLKALAEEAAQPGGVVPGSAAHLPQGQ